MYRVLLLLLAVQVRGVRRAQPEEGMDGTGGRKKASFIGKSRVSILTEAKNSSGMSNPCMVQDDDPVAEAPPATSAQNIATVFV